ncbi:class I adenylate-forming enzyme family protein [Alicyclobacillus tolerans]|uniref:Cyclohexanecarboxylate-CoA ligase/acyl-CoA synthetase n=1 Tax=Alicyclobacillus tolerans TaxID=90970 RepID=A0A1M6MIF6_9BACL|nr:class I adenylate-forming enzyme family protein [Alicyclobacillus montanus]SHJ83204.1 cyclohexanecarboxylate-CoA ligase/acyl-CoA synthetase [Alicyclobacillus montanus]
MKRFPGMVLTEERAEHYLQQNIWSKESFVDVLEQNARLAPDLLHRDEKRQLTYAELWREVESVASSLLQLGVRKGDAVAIQMPNSLDYVVALFGAARIGAVAVLLQTDLGREALVYSLRKSAAKIWIVAESFRGESLIETALAVKEQLPSLEHVILQGSQSSPSLPVRSFEQLCSATPENRSLLDEFRPDPLDPFVMVFTSGTTGSPKGVVQLHANYLWSCRAYAQIYGFQRGLATLNMAPICHQTGMLVGVMMPIATCGRMVLMERFAVSRVLQWIAKEKPTFLCGAPPHLIHVASAPKLRDADTSSVKLFIYAGAPVPSAILQRLQEETGIVVGGMFGWTEGFVACCTRPDDGIEAISKTVGQAVPGIEIVLMDEEYQPVQPGEPGEMWARGPNFSAGYYDNPEASARQWDSEGWFHSGDLFRQDEKGRYIFMGRADDIINRGGTKIDPKSVEDVCAAHPSIQTVAIVGAPDETLGQHTVACVVLHEGTTLQLDELRQFLSEAGLAKFQLPDRLKIMEQLPMTHSGKIKKKELRQMLAL